MRPTRFIGRAGIAMALGAFLGLGRPGTAPGQGLASRQEPPAAVGRPAVAGRR